MGRLDADQWLPNPQSGFLVPRSLEPHTHPTSDLLGTVLTTQIADGAVTLAKLASEAWTSFSSTPTPTSGAFTTASGSGAWVKIGRSVLYRYSATITTVGTGTGDVQFTLPTAPNAAVRAFGVGREDGVSGGIIVVYSGGGSIGQMRAPVALANGQQYNVAGNYEAAS